MALLLLCVSCLVGCGPPDFYKLDGTITKDGRPLPHVQITFAPDAIDSTRPPFTISDENGNFEVTTGREYGLPPGGYTVHIEDPAAADGGTTPKKSDEHYDDYMYACERYSPQNSDLKYEADEHRAGFELKVDTKEYTKERVPLRGIENTTDVD
ncbi:MAG: hypothetical protein Aurels2KO_01580 [Aureliella sp.]